MACLIDRGPAVTCEVNDRGHVPMQSVFKFPLAVTVLHQVEAGKLALDQKIHYLPSDRILPGTHSELMKKYPDGNVDVPLAELLQLSISESDNVATDILLRTVGGPAAVNEYIASLGVIGLHIEDGEAGLNRDPQAQFRNYFEPAGAVVLLQLIGGPQTPLNSEHTALLLGWMEHTSAGNERIGGKLPRGTVVAHKTGSSGTHDGVTAATNDIGLIMLPDGRKLAIAIFLSNSREDDEKRDAIIASLAKDAYDKAVSSVA